MKIAQIAPLMESVPPRLYGGTERVVSHLAEELVRLGHEVTLFASGDSVTSAALVSCATVALRLDPNVIDPIPYYMLMLDRVRQRAAEFDILHFHIDYLHFPLFRYLAGRTVTTLHGRQDLPDIKPIFLGFDEMPLVSISKAQRSPVANASFAATIHHGLPLNLMLPNFEPRGGYLAFIGRISPEKRPDRAISIAVRKQFERRFSSARMVNEYVHLYRRMLHRVRTDKIETEITESPAFNIVENEAIN